MERHQVLVVYQEFFTLLDERVKCLEKDMEVVKIGQGKNEADILSLREELRENIDTIRIKTEELKQELREIKRDCCRIIRIEHLLFFLIFLATFSIIYAIFHI